MNWFIPALVKSSVGSFVGTSEELRTTRWPRSSKNFRNVARTLLPVHCLSVKDALCGNGSLSQRVTALATPRDAARGGIRPNEAKCGKDSCTDSSVQKGTVWKLFRPACTNSVRLFSCFHITSVLISNGNQNMKSHSQSRDLPDRPAQLRPAGLPPLVVHELRATGRESKFTNHESGFASSHSLTRYDQPTAGPAQILVMSDCQI